MSTRATVWIKSGDEERFLYHHCDGYMLDEELDPILKKLTDGQWTVDGVAEAIIEEYEAYGRHKADGVGWDSEYVYKIDVSERTLEKFGCGINDAGYGDRKVEKTQEKYLEKTYRYSSVVIDDEATRAQIIKIQLLELIKFACDCIEHGVVDGEKANKIQEIYKIIHEC
jgi:hypothetical protein